MPGRGPQTFKKRQKEQQRKDKQQEKMARRLARKQENGGGATEDQEAVAGETPETDADVPQEAQGEPSRPN